MKDTRLNHTSECLENCLIYKKSPRYDRNTTCHDSTTINAKNGRRKVIKKSPKLAKINILCLTPDLKISAARDRHGNKKKVRHTQKTSEIDSLVQRFWTSVGRLGNHVCECDIYGYAETAVCACEACRRCEIVSKKKGRVGV